MRISANAPQSDSPLLRLSSRSCWHRKCSRLAVFWSRLLLTLLSLCVTLTTLACDSDQPRTLQTPPGPPTYPVVIAESENLTSIETDAPSPQGGKARVRCETCHAQIDVGTPATAPDELVAFHRGFTFNHGDLECASCHQTNEPLSLRLATGRSIPMEDAMTLCSQCHGPTRRSYDEGSHGGMNGYWDLSRGPRLRNQCVHCHDPHAPALPQVVPVLPPRDRGELPDPHASKEHH